MDHKPSLVDLRRIHLVGVGGTAMGALAALLVELGKEISGSDGPLYPPMSDFLASVGITPLEGYDAAHVTPAPEAAIIGNVIRRDNPEAQALEEAGVPLYSLPEALGDLMLRGTTNLVVTGTHGKTTTTSLLAWLLEAAGKAPSFMVGGIPRGFGKGFQVGAGEVAVVEGDEYDTAYFDKRPKFVHYRPTHGLVTSLELDHTDIYADLDDVKAAFGMFVDLVPPEGSLLVWAGAGDALDVAARARCPVVTYDLDGEADVVGTITAVGQEGTSMEMTLGGERVSFTVPLWGRHNALNAVAAATMALQSGLLGPDEVATGMASFGGVKRRQEILWERNGLTIIDDFGQHPTAVAETIRATKDRMAGGKVFIVYRAESNSVRRLVFQDAFVEAFKLADGIVMLPTIKKKGYGLPGGTIDPNRIIRTLRRQGKAAWYVSEVDHGAQVVLERARPGDAVLLMSSRGLGHVVDALDRAMEVTP